MTTRQPTVLFVCVRNAGKSPMAEALLRRAAGGAVSAASAGTAAGGSANALSVAALAEVGVDMSTHAPRQLDAAAVAGADLVVVLGAEAELLDGVGAPVRRWILDEPGDRGIEGIERMRLVRDDIDRRVRALVEELASRTT